eukprot:248104_1
MSSRKKTSMKITPKKKQPRKTDPKRQPPPSRAQPSPTPKPSKNKTAHVVKLLQDVIQQKNSTIEQLTEKIDTLTMKNKTLEHKIERQILHSPPTKSTSVGLFQSHTNTVDAVQKSLTHNDVIINTYNKASPSLLLTEFTVDDICNK